MDKWSGTGNEWIDTMKYESKCNEWIDTTRYEQKYVVKMPEFYRWAGTAETLSGYITSATNKIRDSLSLSLYNDKIDFNTSIYYDDDRLYNNSIASTVWADGNSLNAYKPPKRRIGCPYVRTVRRRTGLHRCNEAEQKARDLLLRFIGPKRFGRYMRDGFISHMSKSGKVYQIFPSHGHTIVWQNNEKVEELCLCVSGLPPTDSVVMRLLLLQHSEDTFRYHKDIKVWRAAPDRADLAAAA